ncbi:MAG: hypothetical protein V4543_14315 [Bacteroidota bacterium]
MRSIAAVIIIGLLTFGIVLIIWFTAVMGQPCSHSMHYNLETQNVVSCSCEKFNALQITQYKIPDSSYIQGFTIKWALYDEVAAELDLSNLPANYELYLRTNSGDSLLKGKSLMMQPNCLYTLSRSGGDRSEFMFDIFTDGTGHVYKTGAPECH